MKDKQDEVTQWQGWSESREGRETVVRLGCVIERQGTTTKGETNRICSVATREGKEWRVAAQDKGRRTAKEAHEPFLERE